MNNREEGSQRKKPHILVISQYFYPETFRINDMATEWVKRGYKVTVLTGIPNYPTGRFYDGYGYKKKRREYWNGIEIIRILLVPRGNSKNKLLNAMGMIANYFSFLNSGLWWKATTDIHADIVFSYEVSPMTQVLIGCGYARRYHIPHIAYIQDLWPENVEVVAGIHNKVVIGVINYMVDRIYRETDEIFVPSLSFIEAVVNRKVSVDRKKVHYWPQYAEDFYVPMYRVSIPEIDEHDSSFKIAFTGAIGFAQGLDVLPRTAELLKEENVKFIIVGDGRYKAEFERELRRKKVENKFIMIPRQPVERVPEILSNCEAGFISFMDTELFEKTIPAKLQSYMACGMPIIAAAKGETERIINEAECGYCVAIGDEKELAEAIKNLMKSGVDKMSKNSRRYFEEHFEKKMLMDQMDGFLEHLIPV